jgi:hypothetical protein
MGPTMAGGEHLEGSKAGVSEGSKAPAEIFVRLRSMVYGADP